jgi:two-component system copper resistance phosphate regulon response regulator CusR
MRIFLVEDQEKLVGILKKGLELEGFAVDTEMDGLRAYQFLLLNYEDYDIILLDIMLPNKDGVSICRDLRENGVKIPIIFLTAKSEVSEIVGGLNEGADDYIPKPFIFEELVARIRTLLRRPTTFMPTEFSHEGLRVNLTSRKVMLDGQPVELTLKEFGLLEYMVRHPDQVLNREQLMTSVWDMNFESFSNVVDVHVKNLRKKLASWGKHHIETVYGIGYRFKR